MRMFIVLVALFVATFANTVGAGPLDRSKDVITKVVPDLYDISIHLKGGEVVKLDKVGFTEMGIRKRLTINATKKVLTVIPVGEVEVRRIPTADIEKIEMIPHKKPDVVPAPQNVPAPKPVTGVDCKCAD